MKIMIIRHGDPDYPNNTLTDVGFIEAEALGEYYRNYDFKKVFCSPLNRAKYTCDGLIKYNKFNNKDVLIKDWLQEFVYPIDEPVLKVRKNSWDFYPDYFTNNKNLYNNDTYLNDSIFANSVVKEKYNEVISNFDEILKEEGYSRENGYYRVTKVNRDTIVFVCHLGMMNVLLSHLLNIPYVVLCQTFACPPTGVTLLNSEERIKGIAQFRCENYGDVAHLKIKNLPTSFAGRFCEVFDDDTRH